MVITHRRLPGLTRRRLEFGLQSFLLRPSSLLGNILKQIRLSQSQWFRFLLNRFYPSQDDFSAWNRISGFQRTSLLFSSAGIENQGEKKENAALHADPLYLGREQTEFYGVLDKKGG